MEARFLTSEVPLSVNPPERLSTRQSLPTVGVRELVSHAGFEAREGRRLMFAAQELTLYFKLQRPAGFVVVSFQSGGHALAQHDFWS